jgi:hypothetical protein
MKFYRNSPWSDEESSHGYRWFGSKKEAVAESEENPEEYEAGPPLTRIAEEFDISPTKAGFLELLQKVANYPDNG